MSSIHTININCYHPTDPNIIIHSPNRREKKTNQTTPHPPVQISLQAWCQIYANQEIDGRRFGRMATGSWWNYVGPSRRLDVVFAVVHTARGRTNVGRQTDRYIFDTSQFVRRLCAVDILQWYHQSLHHLRNTARIRLCHSIQCVRHAAHAGAALRPEFAGRAQRSVADHIEVSRSIAIYNQECKRVNDATA